VVAGTPGRVGDALSENRLTQGQVHSVLRAEALTHWSWFESGAPSADEAGIRRDGDGWVVYSTDERAGEAYRRRYEEEAPALADFLQKARANTTYFRLLAERSRVQAEEVLRKRGESGG
jgi:hypothetical protein